MPILKNIAVLFIIYGFGLLSLNINAQNIDNKYKDAIDNTDKDNIYYFKLDNGLKLVIKTDNKAPTAIHMIWYKVGSFDELPNNTGLSHILEHMMFKGTTKYPHFSTTMASLGAKENAFTGKDYTVYHQQIPSENLQQVIEMEADRMRNLNFNAANFKDKFDKELKVIQEERRLRTDDQDISKLYEQLMAASYLVNSTRLPTIGWMEDIQNTKIEDAARWYKQYYKPNNATVVIVGNVNPVQVYTWVKNTYSVYKSDNINRYYKAEPTQEGKRTIELYSNKIQEPAVYILYKTLSYKDNPKHAVVLALISTLLAGYEYSYLDKIFVKNQKIASNINVDYSILQRSLSNFIIYAKANSTTDIKSLAQDIHINLNKLVNNLCEEDINRAKKQWLAYNIYKKDSLMNIAMELGITYSNDFDYSTIKNIEKQIQKVTLEDIQQIIQIYFSTNQQNIAFLLPK